jgi:hypothetical protein
MLFICERADLESGQDPGRILNVLLDGEFRNVYDDDRKTSFPVFVAELG